MSSFLEGWKDTFPETTEEKVKEIYEQIRLPKRATAGSAGYDFFSPVDFTVAPGQGTRSRPESVWKWNRSGC